MIKNFTFSEFEKWFFYRIKHDEKYFNDKVFYAFSFTYNFRAFDHRLLSDMRPVYPWKESILIEMKTSETKEYVNEELIKKYKSINEELVRENLRLRSKLSIIQRMFSYLRSVWK